MKPQRLVRRDQNHSRQRGRVGLSSAMSAAHQDSIREAVDLKSMEYGHRTGRRRRKGRMGDAAIDHLTLNGNGERTTDPIKKGTLTAAIREPGTDTEKDSGRSIQHAGSVCQTLRY